MMRALRIVLALGLMAGAACSKSTTAQEPTTAPSSESEPSVLGAMSSPENDAKPPAELRAAAAKEAKLAEDRRKVAERIANFEAAHEQEQARWTDALKSQTARLAKRSFGTTKSALRVILKSDHRSPESKARDPYRHPLQTLAFFGITPKMTVVELGAGGGWYTEILAPLLLKKGKLRVMTGDPEGPDDDMQTAYGKRFAMWQSLSPELYGSIEVVHPQPGAIDLGEPSSADAAIAMREMHGWVRRGQVDAMLAAVHDVLKPGGILGIVQHRAPEGANSQDSAKNGYLPQAWVIEKAQAAGFELVKSSEINANPKDTKDYEEGVWTLPPSLRLGDTDRAKYEAIGESDRMTLKFKKVAKPSEEASADAAETP